MIFFFLYKIIFLNNYKIQQKTTYYYVSILSRKQKSFQRGKIMNYEINEGTLAVMPDTNDSRKSKILEDRKEYIIDSKPYEVMDYSCKYFGSSYEGRKEGTKAVLDINYKVPIIVENSMNLIFFPTNSPDSADCIWISLKNIKTIKEDDFNSTRIIFNNDIEITIPISKRTIENQIFRASRLDLIMRNRKSNKK